MQGDAPPPIRLKKNIKKGKKKGKVEAAGASVGEPLAGLLPAAGGAPHVAVLHPVHLAALLAFAAHLPAGEQVEKHRRAGAGETVGARDGDASGCGGGVGGGVSYLSAAVALGGDESAAMVWERCSPKPWLLLGDTCGDQRLEMLQEEHTHKHTHRPHTLTMLPVNVTGGDCQEMLKLELLVGVKLVQAEPLLVLLEGMETGGVAWGGGRSSRLAEKKKRI